MKSSMIRPQTHLTEYMQANSENSNGVRIT